jgi:radical SAM protein with 4Fe4S-binding SPASM domain
MQCSFCPPSKREKKFMSLDDFHHILKKIQGHGEYVYLHIKGEPLLHPEIKEILELCSQFGVSVNLTTNGTMLLTQKDILLASKSLRQVSVSLQSFEEVEEQERFDAYLKNVLMVVKEGYSSSKVIFELRLWNYNGENERINQDLSRNQKAMGIIEETLELDYSIKDQFQKGKGIKLLPQIYLSKSYIFEWPDMSREVVSYTGSCYGLKQQVGILVNGDVVPCCLDSEGDVILGNVFESKFEDIVTSDRVSAIVKGFEQNKLVEPLCQRCGYRERVK